MTASVNRHTPTSFTPYPLQAPAPRSGIRLQSRSAEVERIEESSCYDTILAKYPGMDSASKAIVKVLCDDQEDVLIPGPVQLSNVGIEGIGEALQQNTNLQIMVMDQVDCLDPNCLIKLGSVLGKALTVNRGLLSLAIGFRADLEIPSLISNLNCFNLSSLFIDGGVLNTAGAEIFSKVFSQKFPLNAFAATSIVWGGAKTTALIANGIGQNSCLRDLDFSALLGIEDLDGITTLFKGIGNSKIEFFQVPQLTSTSNYSFNDAQKTAILEAVKSNSCFLKYSTLEHPFPSDLEDAIQKITQNRTFCPPDPTCDIPQNCSAPSPAPIIPTSPVQVGLAIGIGATLAAVALTALGIFAVTRKCRERAPEETQRLIQ